jgi:Methylamine utilisation protein MauE/AhpC/TSA family
VPPWATRPVAVALPLVEIAVAVALVPVASAQVSAWVALGLLAVFSIAIAVALARGEHPECNCFGAVSARPVGPVTLTRNGVLLALAACVAVLGPGESAGRAFAHVDAAVAVGISVLVLVIAAVGFLAVQFMRQNGRLLARIEALEAALASVDGISAPIEDAPSGLPIGTSAPSFTLTDEHGAPRTLDQLLAPSAPIVLVFSDPGCPGCRLIAPVIEDARGREIPVHIVTSADAPREPGVLHQVDREVMRDYRAHMIPSAVRVDADGRIASELAVGDEAIQALLAGRSVSVLSAELA